jgi:1-acyl-sn-glycerol-3-phosphate acyltransferase
MQNVVIEKPYEFIPPHRGHWWPATIQRLRLIDHWLKKSHGVVSYECRHTQRLRQSLSDGHGIMLTPNHCRACDPVVMGFLARAARTHVYAMASWHLYHQDWLTALAIKKMGGFSVNREGIDRKAIQTAVEILETAERPLIIFPEGATTMTNDHLNALLDGVGFIARAGARKRQRATPGGRVVVHPVALKYLLQDDIVVTTDPVLTDIEHRLTWRPQRDLPLLNRITKVGLSLLTLKEIEYFGQPQQDRFRQRLEKLIDHLLDPLEQEWYTKPMHGPVVPRVKALRMKIMPDMIRGDLNEPDRARRWRQLEDIYLAQQIASYPHDYLVTRPSIDRILETVDRFEEDLTDQISVKGDLHVVIEVGEAIPVETDRDRALEEDPLMDRIEHELQEMLDRLATESPLWEEPSQSGGEARVVAPGS